MYLACTWFVPAIIQVHYLQVQVQVQGTSCSWDAGTGTSTGTAKSVPRYRYRYKYLTPTLLGTGWFVPISFNTLMSAVTRKAVKHNYSLTHFNTLRRRQHGCHLPDILKWILWNENIWILIKISLNIVPRGPINNIPSLVQIMAWPRPGDKPLSEPMMVSLLTHICIT